MKYSQSTQFSQTTIPGSTTGGVFFGGLTGDITQDAINLFWDNTNKRLGINTNTPASRLEIKDNATTSSVVTRITQDDSIVSGLVIGNTSYSSTLLKGMLFKVDDSGGGYIYANGSDASPTNPLILNPGGGPVGINSPVTANAPLDIWASNPTMLLGSDVGTNTRTANTDKKAILTYPHWSTSEENICLMYGLSTATDNQLFVGDGHGVYNSLTQINFYTGNSSTSLTGTLRATLSNVGTFSIASGKLVYSSTSTPGGTTGDRTINKASGSLNYAANATSIVLTNSLITVNSLVQGMILTNDLTAVLKNIVVAAGNATFNLVAATTGETRIGFMVFN